MHHYPYRYPGGVKEIADVLSFFCWCREIAGAVERSYDMRSITREWVNEYASFSATNEFCHLSFHNYDPSVRPTPPNLLQASRADSDGLFADGRVYLASLFVGGPT